MYEALCPACEKGWHDMCSGEWEKVPAGCLGGARCSCKGDCKPRTMSKIIEDARRMEDAIFESQREETKR